MKNIKIVKIFKNKKALSNKYSELKNIDNLTLKLGFYFLY